MPNTVLFVDDEPAALDGYQRMLYRDFAVTTATGGEEALALIEEQGPYPVVISDMRMPGMNGAEFLSRVRSRAPDTVRMLLTGYTDLEAAIKAVNEGNIFRFLTKPCGKDALIAAISAGVEQYRLVSAEKELLEKTLMGSIKVLSDVLAAAAPEAFSRSMRITRYVLHLVEKCRLSSPWRFEAAGRLSQLGCVTLGQPLIEAAYAGIALSAEDRARYAAHPRMASQLLASIPRMEAVSWMIEHQLARVIPDQVPELTEDASREIVLGARILKLAVAFEQLRNRILSDQEVLTQLRQRKDEFSCELIDALRDVKHEGAHMVLRKIRASQLVTGMILQQEIKSKTGVLIVTKGQEITRPLLNKLENFFVAGMVETEITVLAPM